MKILHIRNMANVSYNLAQEQKKLNHQPFIFEISKNPRNIEDGNICLNLPRIYNKREIFNRFFLISKTIIKIIKKENFDIIHLHDGGIYPLDLDIPFFFKRFGRVVVHWHGSKLRNHGRTFGSKFADAEIVSTPDLLEYAPEATWIPNCIQWHGLTKINRNDAKVVIGHAPTNRFYKGTKYFLEAIDQLKKEYPNVECLMIENKPHKEALRLIQTCDIVVDSVDMLGWYGVFTNEAQQMGIPCCTWIKPELEKFLGEPNGIINVTKDNLKEKLENLILNEDLRIEIGNLGKKYVKSIHSNERIIEEIQNIYNNI